MKSRSDTRKSEGQHSNTSKEADQHSSSMQSSSCRGRCNGNVWDNVRNTEVHVNLDAFADTKNDVFITEHNVDVTVPKLEGLGREIKTHVTRLSDIASNAALGYGSPVSLHEEDDINRQKNKCDHLLAKNMTDNFVPALYSLNGTRSRDTKRCLLCEYLSGVNAGYVADKANRLLLEIVYPHEFYDKFQRSGRRSKIIESQRNLESNNESINIYKPVKVSPKAWRRERTTIDSFQPIGSARPDPPNTAREATRTSMHLKKGVNDIYSLKRSHTETEYGEHRREIHHQCKPKQNATIVTDDSEGQKLELKGLKGWFQKRGDFSKSKSRRDVRQSIFKISSLGMNFGIPEYNPLLSERRSQSPRPVTRINSPRPNDVNQSARKTTTDETTSRPQATFHITNEDAHTVPKQPTCIFQRKYTQVPKLFADSNSDDDTKNRITITPTDCSVINDRDNTKMSLPEIRSEPKSRSLTVFPF